MKKVWVVDDDLNLLKVMKVVLTDAGYSVKTFTDGKQLLAESGVEKPDVIISDLQMPTIDGVKLLRLLKERGEKAPVVLLTAHGSIDRAVEAMKLGAYDFLTKPVDNEKILITLRNAIEYGALLVEVDRLRIRRREDLLATIVGESAAIQKVTDQISRVANQPATVLITGETGTGKEIVARAIHASSQRVSGTFAVVNCGAIPENLVESELFGHLRGSFTGATRDRKGQFEMANGGTIFLDEIGEMSLDVQTRLLRALQERTITPVGSSKEVKVDVRVVVATNRELNKEVEEGNFREDLFYRINVFPIEVPPLRDRKDDIPLLIAHLLRRFCTDPPEVSPEALEILIKHDWPGNVRELENALERGLIMSGESKILPEHLPNLNGGIQTKAQLAWELEIPEEGIDLEKIEQRLLGLALEKANGNQSKAARLLNITRSALIYRMEKSGRKNTKE
ncbi:MAG: sigma-54-dependent Fis family transcriptional regulator [Candidatus Lindowbacteria bacterium]|nr:sigma-54-dependent Fis family transcriptional regulator [Candidatus Lindowbacteria bacterium]